MTVVIPPADRSSFLAAHTDAASERIKTADANDNGNLTRAEAASLGDLRDTYDLYSEPGKTVKTEKVLAFYRDYTRVSVKSGELPQDLGDNYSSWLALRARPPAGTDTGAAINAALDDFSVPGLKVAVDAVELRAQKALPNAVGFEDALRSALESFLTDGDDPESPLGIVRQLLPAGASAAEVEAAVRDYLNRPSTELSLMARGDSPEHGESVTDSWVFSLSIPDLSDHGHWAIVDRAGSEGTYNYGFN